MIRGKGGSVGFPRVPGSGMKRKIIIRGKNREKKKFLNRKGTIPAPVPNRGDIPVAAAPTLPRKPKKLMLGFTQDLVALGNLPYYVASNKRGKLEFSMAQALVARMLVLGLTQKKIGQLLGYNSMDAVRNLINKPNFNAVLQEARDSLFGDLEAPLKTIYLRAVNRLQNMVASPDDVLALEACKVVITAMRNTPKQVEPSVPANTGNVDDYKLTSDSRTAGLAALRKMREEGTNLKQAVKIQ